MKKVITLSVMLILLTAITIAQQEATVFEPGQINQDNTVDLSDAVFYLNWLFLGGPDPACAAVTDLNGDDREDLSDPVYLLNYLFLGGPELQGTAAQSFVCDDYNEDEIIFNNEIPNNPELTSLNAMICDTKENLEADGVIVLDNPEISPEGILLMSIGHNTEDYFAYPVAKADDGIVDKVNVDAIDCQLGTDPITVYYNPTPEGEIITGGPSFIAPINSEFARGEFEELANNDNELRFEYLQGRPPPEIPPKPLAIVERYFFIEKTKIAKGMGPFTDVLHGTASDDILDGGFGKDWIYGYSGYDTLYGGNGDDIISGGGQDDQIFGGSGNNKIWGGTGNDNIRSGSDNDEIYGEDGDDTILDLGGSNSIFGGDGDDDIIGGPDIDYIKGDNNDDNIRGGGGDDIISGGDGDDRILGEEGNDVLVGNAGDDKIYGGEGNDNINGGINNDKIWGDRGEDRINPGSGDDIVFGGDDNDEIFSSSGNDIILGEGGEDTIDYIVRVSGASFISVIDGGTQKDHIIVKDINENIIFGGDGDDIIQVLPGGQTGQFIFGGEGADVIEAGYGPDWIEGDDEPEIEITKETTVSEVKNYITTNYERFTDIVILNIIPGEVYHSSASDRIYAGESDNIILGGSGDDYIESGRFDIILGEGGNDVIVDNNAFSVGDIIHGGSGDDRITTIKGDNILCGGMNNDIIRGSNNNIGEDTLISGSGTDRLEGRNGIDTYIMNEGDTTDATEEDSIITVTNWNGDYLPNIRAWRNYNIQLRLKGCMDLSPTDEPPIPK